MSEGSSKAREIDLGNDFGEVVVKVNGTQVTIGADGSIYGPPIPANDTGAKLKTAPEIGDEMEDGTIYAGISPDTHQRMFATPADAPGVYEFNQAAEYAKNLDAHGHHDFRAPSKNELNVLWENRNKGKLAGTFNETGALATGWYWSSSEPDLKFALGQRFSDGEQSFYGKYHDASLRCVR
jgi:hypothetical protein